MTMEFIEINDEEGEHLLNMEPKEDLAYLFSCFNRYMNWLNGKSHEKMCNLIKLTTDINLLMMKINMVCYLSEDEIIKEQNCQHKNTADLH